MSEDLETVIEDSISDATDTSDTEPVEASEPSVDAPTTHEDAPDSTTEDSVDSGSPAATKPSQEQSKPVEDDFAKKHGLQPQVPGQRENRLPYSRVKKIVENAEKKALEPVTAKLTEYEAKVKDYEERLTTVGQFEQVMMQEPQRFLQLLAERVPGYAEIFQQLVSSGQPEVEEKPVETADDMPQPDQQLSDGSSVYSMEGLRQLQAWNREQAKKEALAEVQKIYGPLAEERAAQQRYQAMVPQVQKQIENARKWPGFTENEEAITEALAKDQSLSLEGAYRQVVAVPKLTTDWTAKEKEIREKTRKEVLAELKRAPSTSVAASGTKPRPASQNANRSLEDVIREQVEGLHGR